MGILLVTRNERIEAAIAKAAERHPESEWQLAIHEPNPKRKPRKVFTRRTPAHRIARGFRPGHGRLS
jgi:hypothetical protein